MSAQNKFTTCQFVIEKCDFSNAQLAPTCVKNFCQGEPYGFGSCTVDFTGIPTECCSQSTVGDIAQCMAEFQQQNGFGVFHDACLAVERYVSSCEKAVSNFDSSSYKDQASCLCYDDNNNYDPDTWDNAVATCVSTGQSAHPTIWSALEKNSGAIGLCTKFADAAAATGPATTGPSTTGPAPTDAPSTATGDVSPGTTAGGDSSTPSETGSAVSSPTGSSKQSSTATRSSAAAATTSSAAAPSVGEMGHVRMKWIAVGLGLALPAFMATL
ncbi:hypothetical protein TGAMA5MH_02138 [Trichoderma gamsii]|uniref:Uncharacterized protein n=1 Tax=Trichoderma gamsii TaxID=398673 RepID=A0A2K0TKQ3_9HYPO|nr:hypothetical protein TGAMA5MH_02138 [Trichoderma gamsii]